MKRGYILSRIALLAVAAAFAASCAPVGPPPEKQDNPPVKDPVGAIGIGPPRADLLQQRIKEAIAQVDRRKLQWNHGFWTVFHAILGMGPKHTTLSDKAKERVNALKYISEGGEMRGLQGTLVPTDDGIDVLSPKDQIFYAQGHQDQFVAEMVQWGLRLDYPFVVQGKKYTFKDFVNFSKVRARLTDKQELSWAILIIGEHFGTDYSWTNRYGEKLTFADVVRYEVHEPIEDAACGGTHRLFGLTWVLHRHLERGGKVEGVWKDVVARIERYKRRAREVRIADGSFSTAFFKEREDAPDVNRRTNTTGHIVEWLALAMTDAELREPWMQEAVSALTKLLLDNSGAAIDGGSLYHAVHGLLIYSARVYGPEILGDMAPVVPLPPRK